MTKSLPIKALCTSALFGALMFSASTSAKESRLSLATLKGGGTVSPRFAPALAPRSWQVEFTFDDPRRVSVLLPGEAEPMVYWYVTYQVTNLGRQEVDFYPEFELVTDKLKVIRSERTVSPEAFRAVQRRVNDPLMLPPEKMTGPLLRGEDRARRGVAIFRDFSSKSRAFRLYVAGLSGEVMRVKNPVFDRSKAESPENQRYFTFRKTLEVPYMLPGSKTTRSMAVPERQIDKQRWVMR